MILRLICAIFLLNSLRSSNAKRMTEVLRWKQLDFDLGDDALSDCPSEGNLDASGNINSFIQYNNLPMGASHYKGRVFVTVPRRAVGIPSTLNYVQLNNEDRTLSNPKLKPYPDFETNQLTANSPRLVSVYRTRVDKFGRLWFVDNGMLEYGSNITQIQRPALWVIDLNTDQVIRRFVIPESIVLDARGLASVTVDTDLGAEKTFAYVPDYFNSRLYVYNFETNKMWAFEHNYFRSDAMGGDFNIGGQFFRWNDGIFSLTVGPKLSDNSRHILFHSMSSTNEFVVNNKVLQNEAKTIDANRGSDFRPLGSRGQRNQAVSHAYDPRTNVVFYAEIQRNGVGCWKVNKPFTDAYHGIVDRNSRRMIYPSDLMIDQNSTLWVMTNSMPIFAYSQLDTNQYNFRVWKMDTRDAVEGTVCE